MGIDSVSSNSKSLHSSAASLGYWATTPIRAVWSLGSWGVSGVYNGLKNRLVTPRPANQIDVLLTTRLNPPATPKPAAAQIAGLASVDILRDMGQKLDQFNKPVQEAAPARKEKADTDRELDQLVTKASMYAVVSMMDSKIDKSLLLEIVNTAYSSNRSLYEVFKEKSTNKPFGWQATYFFLYSTGIITNTVEAFMKKVLGELRSELVQKKGGENLSGAVNTMLTHANSFLADYKKAVEEYAAGAGSGTRDQYLEKQLEKPVESISKSFANTAVNEFLPHVEYFKSWKNSDSRILRCFAVFPGKIFEWVANGIMRAILRSQIPAQLQGMIKTSAKTTQEENLSFSISITSGIKDQLVKFKTNLSKTKTAADPSAPMQVIANQKTLTTTVQSLLEVLKLEPYTTREQIKKAIAKGDGYNPLTPEISKNIEESAIDGCKTFLSFLSDPGNSEELFYQIFNLTNTTFEGKQPSTPEEYKLQKESHTKLVAEMNLEADQVFDLVIQSSLKERFQGPSDEEMEHTLHAFSLGQRTKAAKTLGTLKKNSDSMREKLASIFSISSPQSIQQMQSSCRSLQKKAPPSLRPSLALFAADLAQVQGNQSIPWNEVQKLQNSLASIGTQLAVELPSLSKSQAAELRKHYNEMTTRMQSSIQLPATSLCIQDELQSTVDAISAYQTAASNQKNDHFPKAIRKGIQVAMNPIYSSFSGLVDLCNQAKSEQESVLKDSAVVKEMRLIDEMLREQQTQIPDQIELISKQWPFYRNALERIRAQRDAADAEPAQLDAQLTNLEATHINLSKETQILQDLRSLGEKGGLLSQLGKAVEQRAAGENPSFHWKDSDTKIKVILSRSIPGAEKDHLKMLIDQVANCRDEKHLAARWDDLRKEMKALFVKHNQAKIEADALFLKQFQEMRTWTGQNLEKLEDSLETAQVSLQKLSERLSKGIAALETEVSQIDIEKVDSIDTKLMSALGGPIIDGLGGALVGWGFSGLLGPWAPPVIGGLAGAVSAYKNKGSLTTQAITNTAMSGARHLVIFPEVKKVFTSGYQFITQPHVWKWALVDGLDTIDKAYTPSA